MTVNNFEFVQRLMVGNGRLPEDQEDAPDNPPVVRIVEFTNAWGKRAWGLELAHEVGRFAPSEYVNDPVEIWRLEPAP